MVMILCPDPVIRHRVRRNHEYGLSVQIKIIRAFKNPVFRSLTPHQYMTEFPVKLVRRMIQQHTSSPFHFRSKYHIPAILFFPYIWISPFKNIQISVNLRGHDRIALILFPRGHSIFAYRAPLLGARSAVSAVFLPPNARIIQKGALPVRTRAAGKTVDLSQFPGRRQSSRQMIPVNAVLAYRMSPVKISPLVSIGIILIKQMVAAFIPAYSVWIIHPVFSGKKVIGRFIHISFPPVVYVCILQGCIRISS